MISRWLQLLVFVLAATVVVFAQARSEERTSVLIDPTKAPVYLEFVRTGKCTKDSSNFNFDNLCDSKRPDARTYDAAWLRLVNNTRWSVGLTVEKGATEKNASSVVIESTTFTDDAGEKAAYGKMVANNRAEMDVVYKSESETGCDFSKETPKGKRCFRRETTVPVIQLPGVSSDLFVAPGQSIVFPIDRAHIKEYVNLYVLYNFSWEYSGRFFSNIPHYDSQHRAYFGWFDLEKGIKTEREKKSIA